MPINEINCNLKDGVIYHLSRQTIISFLISITQVDHSFDIVYKDQPLMDFNIFVDC